MLKIIDRYIIRKYISTFLFSMLLIMLIAVVFDIAEKLDNFMANHAPMHDIVVTYYLLGFIPYYVLLFTSLLLFLSVVFFTSRMAYKSEIVAILSSGITFNRFLKPYLMAAVVIVILNIGANMWLLPYANKNKLHFERIYVDQYHNNTWHLHFQIGPQAYAYLETYDVTDSVGNKFAYEKFNNRVLIQKIQADRAKWDEKHKAWHLITYTSRYTGGNRDWIGQGTDTMLKINLAPADFDDKETNVGAMDETELNHFIAAEKVKGTSLIPFYMVEKYRRVAFPFALLMLTIIGVSLTSRKVRGGSGLHFLLGIALCFGYIVFMQFTTTFSTKGNLPPIVGVWIPNIVYAFIAYYLYRRAPK